jgi:hypothetical protein
MVDKVLFRTVGLIVSVLVVNLSCVPPARADGYKQHKAHVHGIAHLNIAQENNDLYIEPRYCI